MKIRFTSLALLASICLLASCSKGIYPTDKATKAAYKKQLNTMKAAYETFDPVKLPLDSVGVREFYSPSPNFNRRTPNLIIIHQTEQNSCMQSLKTLTDATRNGQVSAHYLICKDGTVYQLVSEEYRAWQAGISKWGHITNVNSVSVGIELDNTGKEPFPDVQMKSLLVLLNSLKSRYHIPQGNFVGHADIAPTRKQDPSIYFPWQLMAEHGYSYWSDSTLLDPPPGLDAKTELRLIGYDTRDLSAAIVAFKRHYIKNDLRPILTDYDKKVLYSIFLKYDQ